MSHDRPYMISGVLVECLCWTLLSLLPGSIVLTACLMFIQKMGSLCPGPPGAVKCP